MLCRGRQYGDPLARSALGECTLLNGKSLWLCTALVGVANLATRRPRNRAVMYNDGRLPYVAALPPTGRQIGDPYGWCGNRMRRLCRRRVVRQLNAAALPPTGRQIGDPYRGAAIKCSGSAADGSTGGGMAMIHHRGSGSNPPATSNDYFQHTAKHFDIRHRCG